MSLRSKVFRNAFHRGLSGFRLRRDDPRATLSFRLEPREFYELQELRSSGMAIRLLAALGFLFPSLIFSALVISLENEVPLAWVFSSFVTRGIGLSEAMLLGIVVFEIWALFRRSARIGPRQAAVAATLAIVLVLKAWPNALILLACGACAMLHARLEERLMKSRQSPRVLSLEPLVMALALAGAALAAWGSPWTSLALVSDVWSDNVLSGQLSRSCLWAALGPAVLPVLLFHLGHSIAGGWGLCAAASGLTVLLALMGGGARPGGAPEIREGRRARLGRAFETGFMPALAILTLAGLLSWPESLVWENTFYFVMLLGFALRARGWNLKILVSLAWVVLCLQTIVENLSR